MEREADATDDHVDSLQLGIREGWIRPPQREGTVGIGFRATATASVLETLAEDRGD